MMVLVLLLLVILLLLLILLVLLLLLVILLLLLLLLPIRLSVVVAEFFKEGLPWMFRKSNFRPEKVNAKLRKMTCNVPKMR